MRWAALSLALLACGREYTFSSVVDVHPDDVTRCDFLPVEGAPAFQEYSCNPVFVASEDSWEEGFIASSEFAATEVAGHAFYQIWYTSNGRVGTAASANGTDWTAHDDNPGMGPESANAWDAGQVQTFDVAWDDEELRYYALYNARNPDSDFFGTGSAASDNGIHWTKHPDNPVLSNSLPFGDARLSWPVNYTIVDGEHIALFAANVDGPDDLSLVELQTSSPGLWPIADTRVLAETGPPGSWDDRGFLDAAIVELDGRQWMFYVGFGSWSEPTSAGVRSAQDPHFGVQISDDGGATWSRPLESFLPIEQVPGGARSVAARVIGSRIHLWLTDTYENGSGVGYFVFEPEQMP